MKSTAPPRSTPAAQCVPFQHATPAQIFQAKNATRQALGDKFFALLKTTWDNVFATLQPDLWVTSDSVSLNAQDLARVALRMDALRAEATARAGHGPRQYHYTRLPMRCPDEVLRALVELEADPGACGPVMYHYFTGVVRRHAKRDDYGWATVQNPREEDGADPDQARAALLARVAALDRARSVPGAA